MNSSLQRVSPRTLAGKQGEERERPWATAAEHCRRQFTSDLDNPDKEMYAQAQKERKKLSREIEEKSGTGGFGLGTSSASHSTLRKCVPLHGTAVRAVRGFL